MTPSKLAPFCVSLAVALAIPFAGPRADPSSGDIKPLDVSEGPVVSVAEARYTQFTETILVTGSLVAREEVLVSPQIDGYSIVEVLAEEGDRVKQGQLLAKLDRSTLETQLAQYEASYARAEASIAQAQSQIVQSQANLKQAEAAFQRAKDLLKTGSGTQAVYDEREATARTSAANLSSAEDGLKVAQADKNQIAAQIREIKLKLGYTEIRAPADGVISRRTARVGATASSASEPLFRIVTKGEIELEAEVPEIYLPKLAVGNKARINVAGIAEKKGVTRLISPEVDKSTRLGKVRIFLGDDPELRVGTFARGLIDIASSEGVGVPASALLYTADGASLQVVRNSVVEKQRIMVGVQKADHIEVVSGINVVETRPVKVGLRMGDQVEILTGLKDGELVVARAGTLLRDGDVVRPIISTPRPTTVSEAR